MSSEFSKIFYIKEKINLKVCTKSDKSAIFSHICRTTRFKEHYLHRTENAITYVRAYIESKQNLECKFFMQNVLQVTAN